MSKRDYYEVLGVNHADAGFNKISLPKLAMKHHPTKTPVTKNLRLYLKKQLKPMRFEDDEAAYDYLDTLHLKVEAVHNVKVVLAVFQAIF